MKDGGATEEVSLLGKKQGDDDVVVASASKLLGNVAPRVEIAKDL